MLVLVVFVRALRQRSWKNFTQETVCGKNLTYFLFFVARGRVFGSSKCSSSGDCANGACLAEVAEVHVRVGGAIAAIETRRCGNGG